MKENGIHVINVFMKQHKSQHLNFINLRNTAISENTHKIYSRSRSFEHFLLLLETAMFLKCMKFKYWLLCCFIKTLITCIPFSFMNWTYMQPKTRFICCFVVTLITCITLSFMDWGYMWFETGFLYCFVVTIMTWIACTIMDCGYMIWNMLFFVNCCPYRSYE